MEDMTLTDEELGTLLGGENVSSGASSEKRGGLEAFRAFIQPSLPSIQRIFSEKLTQEVAIELKSIEELNEPSADGAGQWYIGKGNFSNDGKCAYAIVLPDTMAHEFAKQVTGISDLENTMEQIGEPLKELCSSIVGSIAAAMQRGFSGSVESFDLSPDMGALGMEGAVLRIQMNVDGTPFYHFFDLRVLSMIESKEETKEGNGSDAADNILSAAVGANAKKDKDGSGDIFSSMDSLGESLLKDESSVSNVEFSEFSQAQDSEASIESKKISMLMDVSVDVVVELGHTKRNIAEVLGLSRGSILDLNKLAGEPLDVKVNEKLIAKEEVIVIDENFGVRIVEIISSSQKK